MAPKASDEVTNARPQLFANPPCGKSLDSYMRAVSLGFCAIGHQNSDVARDPCDAFRRILIRPVGPVAVGHDASTKTAAQKAEVGYCPCCTQATHIAATPTFTLGDYSSIKELGMSLWAADGLWAGRRLAAVSYVMGSNGAPLPMAQDWAARSLEFTAPDPPIRPHTQGTYKPISAVDGAEKQNKRPMMDLNRETTPDEPQLKLDKLPIMDLDERTAPVEPPLNLGALIPPRVRFDKHTRLPVDSASKGASKTNPVTPGQ